MSPAPPVGGATESLVYRPDLPRAEGRASWIEYATFAEVLAQADAFVVGTVVSVAPGREAGSKFPIPTTVSEIEITDVGKGSLERGVIVRVEQTGGVYRPAHAEEHAKLSPGPLPAEAPGKVEPLAPGDPPDEVVLELVDDPLYYKGERVALALRWIPDLKVYQLVGPQGRFRIDEANRAMPMLPEDSAVKDFAGLSVADLVSRVREF